MAIIHFHMGFTWTIDTLQLITGTASLRFHIATTDSCNLATAEDAVAHHTSIEDHVGLVDGTVVDIATAKQTAGIFQFGVGHVLGVVFYLFNVFVVFIFIADITLVEFYVGRTIHSTTLATTVGVSLDGWYAVGKAAAVEVADDHIGLSGFVASGRIADVTRMQTDISFPTATIDVTTRAALDISRGTGSEAIRIVILTFGVTIVGTGLCKAIVHSSSRTGGIDILAHLSAKQCYIGMPPYVTAHGRCTRTVAATVSIVHHFSTLVDDHVGVVNLIALRLLFRGIACVVSLVNLCLSHQRGVSQTSEGVEIVVEGFVRRVVVTQRPGIYPSLIPLFLDGMVVVFV